MKSPEYAAATVRLYRAVIDEGDALDDARYDRLVRDAQRTFAREPTTGWLRSSSGSRLVDDRFPGHRGARLGAVTAVRRERRGPAWVRLTLEGDLSLRDGLAFMSRDGTEQSAFSVQAIRKGGRDARFARTGETVEVRLPEGLDVPEEGREVRQLSSRFLDLPEPKEASVRAYRSPVAIEVVLDGAPGGDASLVIAARDIAGARVEERVNLEEAAHPRPFLDILGPLLAESGASAFVAAGISLANATGLADDRIFVPPSQLKRAKNLFYARLDEVFRASVADRAVRIGRGPHVPARPAGSPSARRSSRRSPTAPRSLRGAGSRSPSRGSRRTARSTRRTSPRARASPWFRCRRSCSTPRRWTGALERLAAGEPDVRFAVGLANLSHLAIAQELAPLRNVSFFADFHLYTANRWTAAFLFERVPRLLFAYRWIEDGEPAGDHEPASDPARLSGTLPVGRPSLRCPSSRSRPVSAPRCSTAAGVSRSTCSTGERAPPGALAISAWSSARVGKDSRWSWKTA